MTDPAGSPDPRLAEGQPDPAAPLGTPAAGPLSGAAGVDEPVVELEQELASGGGDRLARYTRRAAKVVTALAVLIVATGLLGLVLGLAAWHGSVVGIVLVLLLCLPAVVLPIYVSRRAKALAEAAGHPKELAAQARDLMGQVRTSPELRSLATQVRQRRLAAAAGGGRLRKVRGAFGLARLASTVVGQAEPDPVRHRLVQPFGPERLRNTWAAATWSVWAAGTSAVVAVVSAVALLVRAL